MPADLFEHSGADLSPCGRYRYSLTRRWDDAGRTLVWVMLNPSTADAHDDDPTIRRIRGFTKREGYGGFVVLNIWAIISPDPKVLKPLLDQVDVENMERINWETLKRDVVVAWGRGVRGASPAVLEAVRDALCGARSVRCLGYTKAGQPRHPLMLRKDTPLERWKGWRDG